VSNIVDATTIARLPLLVSPTRVYRVYEGGKLLDSYRGAATPEDGYFPEDWVGSDTRAINPGREHLPEGLSFVELPDGGRITLKDLIEQNPEDMLGAAHVACWGARSALLVKLLDSAVRLPVHCHPDRAFAREHMGSMFGKTECWIIREVRQLDGVEPYIALGFKPGVTREQFWAWIQAQDSAALLDSLHCFPVEPGDVYFVQAGAPHAIGEGVFMIEVQEPSDWAIMAEYAPFSITEEGAHQGRGWELGLDCFDYTTYTEEEARRTFKQETPIIRREGDSYERRLISDAKAEFFGAHELVVQGSLSMPGGGFYVGIVEQGTGDVVTEQGELHLARGATFVMPAAAGAHEYRSTAGEPLEVVVCFPPTSPQEG
jgi:mannose-6-phosphate isomerase